MTPEMLETTMKTMSQPAYRAGQLFGWLHQAGAQSLQEMTNLPANLRAALAQNYRLDAPEVAERQVAEDGTQKLLLRLEDGNCVETVLMQYRYGPSVCVSSQVGCRMGCAFCASATGGLVRSLTAGEMAAQVYTAGRLAQKRVSHVVLMGIGEPMDNLDNVLGFVRILTHPKGYDLSGRAISLSTCGVVPGIEKLAQQNLPLTLSISLHAAQNEKRRQLMPAGRAWPLEELMAACRAYQKHTGRRISYEYALLRDVNDTDADADALIALLKGSGGHVNLIRANAIPGAPFAPSTQARTQAFVQRLNSAGLNATLRRRLGAEIDAACGQLRIKRGGPTD